jgi:ADP-ribosylglycohydrolase
VVLHEIRAGLPWRQAAGSALVGRGRAATALPCASPHSGPDYADQPRRAARQALASAEVTHAHPQGIVGAVAVAVCAA